MTTRQFYRTVLEVEILSEVPYDVENLQQIAEDITYGDCSGITVIKDSEMINSKVAADLLIAHGSDPQFFGLDEEGADIDDFDFP